MNTNSMLPEVEAQQTHSHNSKNITDKGVFVGCKCQWCFKCGNAPRDCKCNDDYVPTMKHVKEHLSADSYSFKDGRFIVRRHFFYRMGNTAETFAARVLQVYPHAHIFAKGEHYAAFRGGASLRNSSHWWVEFTFNQTNKETQP